MRGARPNTEGRYLRAFRYEVEVAADALRSGHEGRSELHARTLGNLGRRQRIPDRTEILELMLGRPEPVSKLSQVMLPHSGF